MLTETEELELLQLKMKMGKPQKQELDKPKVIETAVAVKKPKVVEKPKKTKPIYGEFNQLIRPKDTSIKSKSDIVKTQKGKDRLESLVSGFADAVTFGALPLAMEYAKQPKGEKTSFKEMGQRSEKTIQDIKSKAPVVGTIGSIAGYANPVGMQRSLVTGVPKLATLLTTKAVGKVGGKMVAKKIGKKAVDKLGRKAVEKLTKELGKEAVKGLSENIVKKMGKNAVNKLGKKAIGKMYGPLAKKTVEKLGKKTLEKTGSKAIGKISTLLAKKTGEAFLKSAGKHIAKEGLEAAASSTIEGLIKGKGGKQILQDAAWDMGGGLAVKGTGEAIKGVGKGVFVPFKKIGKTIKKALPVGSFEHKGEAADKILKKSIFNLANATVEDMDKNVASFNKYNLHSKDIEGVTNKVKAKLNDAGGKIGDIIKKSSKRFLKTDIDKMTSNMKNEMKKNRTEWGSPDFIDKTVKNIDEMYDPKLGKEGNKTSGKFNIEEGVKIKKWLDRQLNWERRNPNSDSNSIKQEKIFREYRKRLNRKLEKMYGEKYKKLNRVYSDLKPIEKAVKKFHSKEYKKGAAAPSGVGLYGFTNIKADDNTKDMATAQKLRLKQIAKDKNTKFLKPATENISKLVGEVYGVGKAAKKGMYDPAASNYAIWKSLRKFKSEE
jgi:hypothetical protein